MARVKQCSGNVQQYGRGMQTYSAPPLQKGYGMAIYRGRALQRGHGLGGLFKGLFRLAAPIIKRSIVPIGKRALKAVGKKALKAGANAVKDIVEDNVSVKNALKNRAAEVVDPRNYTINTSTRKRKANRSSTTSQKKAKRNKKYIDAPHYSKR